MGSTIQNWLALPTLGLAIALVVTVIGARLTTDSANILLAVAWILATISIFTIPPITQSDLIPRILYTLLLSSAVGLGLYQLRWVEPTPPTTLIKPSETTPTITLTVRFDPLVFFPFSIPAQTTSYAILARPKEDIPWGAYEIKNDGNSPIIWPEKQSLKWGGPKLPQKKSEDFPGMPDMAIALDITNHSNNELIDVKAEVEFAFAEAIQEEKSVRSGPVTVTRRHTAIIPILKQNRTVRLYIGNQSSKHFVVASFPTEATALVPSETERRKIKLVKIGTNVVEALPMFSLSPAKVRWSGFPTGD
ncbi:hypothetical protein [Nitrospira japonica]|nr:hypothetical protein [Nitrospira japonica]